MTLTQLLAGSLNVTPEQAVTLIQGGKVYVNQIQKVDPEHQITSSCHLHVTGYSHMWVTV